MNPVITQKNNLFVQVDQILKAVRETSPRLDKAFDEVLSAKGKPVEFMMDGMAHRTKCYASLSVGGVKDGVMLTLSLTPFQYEDPASLKVHVYQRERKDGTFTDAHVVVSMAETQQKTRQAHSVLLRQLGLYDYVAKQRTAPYKANKNGTATYLVQCF